MPVLSGGKGLGCHSANGGHQMEPVRDEYVARLEEALNRLIKYMGAAASAHQAEAPGPTLSGSQRIVLRALINDGPCPVSEVANHLGVTLSAATGLVDRLVKSKLATRDRDQVDRRVVWVKITPEGEEAVRAAEARRRAAIRKLVRDLPERDLAQLSDILERLG